MTEASDKDMAAALVELVDAFQDDTGRRPWAVELQSVLTTALRSLRDDVVTELCSDAELHIDTIPDTGNPPGGLLLGELNDAAFVAAADLIAGAAAHAHVRGAAATPSYISGRLEEILRPRADSVLGDEPPTAVVSIEIVGAAGKKPKVGDIVAIPADDGKHFIAVVVAKNGFGVAYGLFDGTHPSEPVSADDHPPTRPRPVYDGDEAITSGRWKVIGHDTGLVKLFPGNPEIFHAAGPQTGPYGAGETADGELRELSQSEAREIGLEDGSYRQVYLPEDLERWLEQSRS